MHKQGTIVRWDASRGFGFIRSPDTSADVFFHVRDFRGASEPTERMAVDYEEIHVGGKGPRAVAVRPRNVTANASNTPAASTRGRSATMQSTTATGTRADFSRSSTAKRTSGRESHASGRWVVLLLLPLWLSLIGWALWSARLPLWCAGALLGLQLLTAWMYAHDKNAARAGNWRVSENQLHLLALLGGWPAAWWAQQSLRHKTSKVSFRAVYWLTIVLHCGGLVLWLWRGSELISL